ncbi:MAG: hypothetical protein QW520_05240, partial [Methanomassiliicoccales archaeon]
MQEDVGSRALGKKEEPISEVSGKRSREVVKEGKGVMIVLTASEIEMSDFNLNPFLAFAGGFPNSIVSRKLYPPLPCNPDGSARFAPYGLRKVETLLADRFGEENVVVTPPSNLHLFIGPATKIIGISTMDPLGTGFVSRTYSSLLGLTGKPATLAEFEKLVKNPSIVNSEAKLVVGGAGAWQISEAGLQESLGIDSILIGQSESSLVEIFEKALNGEMMPQSMVMDSPSIEDIPLIKNPSLYGVVEITRGCGRGCAFCSPTARQRISIPHERVLKEVELNAKAGSRMIMLQTDDVFLYQAQEHFLPNKEAIVKLIKAVDKVEGVEFI